MASMGLAGAPASGATGPGPTSCTAGWTVVAQQTNSFTWTEPLPGLRAVSWTGTVQLLENLDVNCYVLGIRIRYTGPTGGTLAITRDPFVSFTVQYPGPFTDYGNVGANAYGDLVSWTPAAGTYVGYRVETHFDINARGADEYFVQGLGLGGVVSGVVVTFGLPMSLLGKTIYAQIHVGRNLCQCSVTSFAVPGSAPPFDFSLAVSPTSGTVTAGGSVTATVTATLISGTSVAVTFSASGLPSGATASFAPTSCVPTCSTTMTISTSTSTPAGTYSITIQAVGGGVTRTTTYSLTVQAPFNFNLAVSPTAGTVTAGGSVTATVTATLVSGTSVAVTFSTTGLPSGATASFAPTSCVPTCTSTMTISTTTSTPAGTYSITVKAVGGGVTRTTAYSLTVRAAFNFNLAVSPTSGTVTAGGSVTATVTATLVSGTSVSVTFSTTGLPSGATASFAPTACVPTCSSTMTISTTTSTPSGTYSITVKAAGGGVTRTTTYSLTVQAPFNFNLGVSPTAGTVAPGGSVTATVTATLTSGTPAAVTFSATGLPMGATASFAPSQCLPTCTSTMTLSTTTSTPDGTYTITVQADGGGVTRTTTYSLTVQSAPPSFDFAISVAPTSDTVTAGGSTTANVTATLVSGTAVSVTFTANGLPVGATASFAPTSCVPTCSSAMTISTTTSTPSGTYSITVQADGGGVTRTTTYALTVQSPPPSFDFGLSVDPTSGTVTAGGSATTNVTATLLSGTGTTVTFTAAGLPTGATAAFSPTACVPTCASRMTISTTTSTPNGTYEVAVTASGGGATHSATYTLTVNPPPPAETWDVYVHAHEDDWQLFLSPNTYYDYQAGHHLLFVYVTAGDAGRGASYSGAREQASQASVQYLVGNNFPSASAFVTVCYTDTTTVCHDVWRWTLNRTVSVYMRLPDGNSDGNGFPSTQFRTLEKLRDGVIPTLSAVDNSTTYNGWRDFYLTIAAIITAYAPYDATTQVNAPDFDRVRQSFEGKTCNGCSDHPDHLAVGDAVYNITIAGGTPWRRAFFIDYPLGWADFRYPANLGPVDYNFKKQVFLRYRDAMLSGTGEDVYAMNPSFWENIFHRQYYRML